MISLLLVCGLSFVLCLALTPPARALARRLGLVDQPDGRRKIHKKVVPVSGGLAILMAIIGSLGAALLFTNDLRIALLERESVLFGLLLGSLVICAVGVADDFGLLRGRHKLMGQLLAVGVVIGLGGWVHTVELFGIHVELGWFGIPFTMFFIVGAINSLNLIDGMDGLLGSVGVILSLALGAMAILAGQVWAATIALALAGALFGFLRYNLPPASVFLGDSGSMLIGLVLGVLSVQCSLKAPATIALAMPIALLILPIFDTAAAIIRRKLTGRSVYDTDRGHLHHCLLRRGLSNRWALVLVSVCCVTACAGVLASQAFNHQGIALVTAACIIGTLIITRLFGHAEMMLIKGRLVSLFWSERGISHMEVRLQGSADWKDLWDSLKLRAEEMNLLRIWMDVNAPALHEGYHARWDQTREENLDNRSHWHVEVPMTADGVYVGRLVLEGKPDDQPIWAKIAVVMQIIDDFCQPKGSSGLGKPHRFGKPPFPADSEELVVAAAMEPAQS